MTNIEKSPKRSSTKILFASAFLMVALVAGSIYVTFAPQGNEETQTQLPATGELRENLRPLAVGDMAALFIVDVVEDRKTIAFQDDSGGAVALGDWQGRIVLVNLWATWCPPCRAEMPALDALQARLGSEEFEVVAINIDRGGTAKGEAFYEEIGLENLGFYYDGTLPGLVRELAVIGMPTTLLIDRQGGEIARIAGPAEWASDDAVKLIETAIAAGKG
jgi:thiol-disulfide isomerase/thioredoxin